jgi:hypothetical protein
VQKATAIVFFLIVALATFASFQARRWSGLGYFEFDPGGYVAPLQSVVVEGKLGRADSLEVLQRRFRPGSPVIIGRLALPNGRVITKYPIGLAVLNAPWYVAAHLYTQWRGEYPANGFSRPYQRAIALAGLFHGLLGLWLLARLLQRWFTDSVIAWTIGVIGVGTNLLNYMAYEGGMTHAALFMWQVGVLAATVQWHQTGQRRAAIAVGFFLGMATLTRPTDVLLGLIPLLWGVGRWADIQPRLHWLWEQRGAIIGAGLMLLAVVGLQLGYWKLTSGHWVIYSYKEEGFDFAHPHVFDGLFSFKKGWLLYTPLMAVALLGTRHLRRYVAAAWGPLLVLLPIFLYVTFCWWQWWYGGSFSCRPAISLYPLLALPLASWLTRAATQPNRRIFTVLRTVLALGISLNMWQTWQYHLGILHWENNTATEYFRRFFEG